VHFGANLPFIINAQGVAPIGASLAAAIGFRRVQQRDTSLDGVIQEAEGGCLIDFAAKRHAA